MDGPVEHSDSDSGESWTLLENNSIYADDAPELIDEEARHEEAQQHEKDEDTDGISIISDSDHEAPSPPPPDDDHHANFEKCPLENDRVDNLQPENDIPEYIPVTSHLSNIDNEEQGPVTSEYFMGGTHSKHKTYVHRRNKRLSTVLNIIVLGSVITAAGVAIGHMWGAKNDCAIQSTSSVHKILSNLYKLQEENAYLRSKLKEFTSLNNNPVHQQKMQSKHNKCRRVFEDSLSNNDPKKLTKCVDEKYKNVDNLMEHLVKPKFEKEFVADIDKLKTVYLQNKSWLDDEISRRMKIEEELLKKYNNEVNLAKDQKKEPINKKNDDGLMYRKEKTLDSSANIETPSRDYVQKKVTYADSLQSDGIRRFKREHKKYAKVEDHDWFTSKHNINNFGSIKQDFFTSNAESKKKPEDDDERFVTDFLESAEKDNKNRKGEFTASENWTEVKPKFRRNEERYEADYDKSFLQHKQKINHKQEANDYHTEENIKFANEERYSTVDNSWSKHAQEDKMKVKKENRNSKQSSNSWKNDSNENKVIENFVNEEDIVKDDRYVVNKLKQEKKKNGYVNSSKKQKRKYRHDRWNTKGELGHEAVETPEDFGLNYPVKTETNFERVAGIYIDDIGGITGGYKDNTERYGKSNGNVERNEKKMDDLGNWYEKRAVFRTEARKKYHEQFSESSPNNSSWYFRRMRKREQCRAKGDNSTFRKVYKDKKIYKMKH